MITKLRHGWQAMRSSFWFVPALMVVDAVVTASMPIIRPGLNGGTGSSGGTGSGGDRVQRRRGLRRLTRRSRASRE